MWDPYTRPADLAESRIVQAILNGQFPIHTTLPSERRLSEQLGVTRPTLREVLQRLARDGWLEIQHGKPTRVRDYLVEGNLGVLSALARHPEHIPPDFISHLLHVRMSIAPDYTRTAVANTPQELTEFLTLYQDLPDVPETYANADWELHRSLSLVSGNPVYTLILNGFNQLYLSMAETYFDSEETRAHSNGFYVSLRKCCIDEDPESAQTLTRTVMGEAIDLWREISTMREGEPA
jgi:GntR family negative regulator for fad regulon and positive regulator of fabA